MAPETHSRELPQSDHPLWLASLGLQPELTGWRRHLHRQPELSFEEEQTGNYVEEVLRSFGITNIRRVAGHGRVAEFGDASPGPTVALRADMDALPIQEQSTAEYASVRANTMHACGHDAHTSMLLGAARILHHEWREGRLPGRVRLLFQPAEETANKDGLTGGMMMIQEGALEEVDAVFAQHVSPSISAGKVSFQPGLINASSDNFSVEIRGKSAHGAMPNLGKDAVVLAARLVQDLQTLVSREIDPCKTGVITVGELHAGTAPNVIASKAILRGTMRCFDEETRETLLSGIRRCLASIELSGAEAVYAAESSYPVGNNHTALTEWLKDKVAASLGGTAIHPPIGPSPGSEDFSCMSAKIPGCLFRIGVKSPAAKVPKALHSSNFDIDENSLPVGCAVLCLAALDFLRESPV
jgi:amidohydrolase